MTPEEIEKLQESLNKQYELGQLDFNVYKTQFDTLEQQRQTLLSDPSYTPPDLGKALIPEVTQQYEPSNIEQARNKYLQYRMDMYKIQGLDPLEAEKRAVEDANQITKPITAEYIQPPETFVSRVIDPEKGLILDEVTGKPRQATSTELLTNAFKRQQIAKLPEYTQALEHEQRRINNLANLESIEIQEANRYYLQQMMDNKLSADDAKIARSQAVQTIKNKYANQRAIASGLQTVQDYLLEPSQASGTVIETPLGAGLRVFNMAPSVIAEVADWVIPFQEETDLYRYADSGSVFDQVMLNYARGQGVANLVSAGPLSQVMGETPAFVLGMGAEMFLPATGIGTTIRASKKGLTQASIKALEMGDKPIRQGSNITYADLGLKGLKIGSPIESAKLNATMKTLDDMISSTDSPSKTTSELLQDYLQTTPPTEISIQGARISMRDTVASELAQDVTATRFLREYIDNAENLDSMTMNRLFDDLGNAIDNPSIQRKLYKFEPQQIIDDIIEKSDEYKNLARTNKEFAQIYNQADAGAKLYGDAIRKGEQTLLRTTPLTTKIIDNLANVGVSKAIVNELSFDSIPEYIQNFTKTAVKNASFDDLLRATNIETSRILSEQLKNVLPDNLGVVVSNYVAPIDNLTNQSKLKTFQDDVASVWKQLDTTDVDTIVIPQSLQQDILSTLIEYAGVDAIRQSKVYTDMLNDIINNNGIVKKQYEGILRNALIAKSAKENLGAYKFVSGGEQFKRAMIPAELQGDVVATARTQNTYEQITQGSVGQVVRDIKVSLDLRKQDISVYPSFEKITPDTQIPSDMLLTINRISAKRGVIQKTFDNEWKQLTRKYKDPIKALDEMNQNAWDIKIGKRIESMDDMVVKNFNPTGMEPDYVAYAYTFQKQKYLDQMVRNFAPDLIPDQIREMGIDDIKNLITDRLKISETQMQDLMREIIIDYDAYETTIDTWRSWIRSYYGEKLIKGTLLDGEVKLKEYINASIGGGVPLRTKYIPKKSNYLQPNYTNFQEVIRRIEQSDETFRGKGLQSVGLTGKAEYATVYVPMDWTIGIREGAMVQEEMQALFDANPSLYYNMVPNYTGAVNVDKSRYLTNQYNTLMVKLEDITQREIFKWLAKEQNYGYAQNLYKQPTWQQIKFEDRLKILDDIRLPAYDLLEMGDREEFLNILHGKKTFVPSNYDTFEQVKIFPIDDPKKPAGHPKRYRRWDKLTDLERREILQRIKEPVRNYPNAYDKFFNGEVDLLGWEKPQFDGDGTFPDYYMPKELREVWTVNRHPVYSKPFEESGYLLGTDSSTRIAKDIRQMFQNEVPKMVEELVSKHIDTMNKISMTQRKKIIEHIVAKYGSATEIADNSTLMPDLSSISSTVKEEILEMPLIEINSAVKSRVYEIIRNAINESKFPVSKTKPTKDVKQIIYDNLVKQIDAFVYNLVMPPIDNTGRYLYNPSYSVVDDALFSVRDFYRAKGIAVENDILHVAGNSFPASMTINMLSQNPNAVLVSQGMLNDINQITDMAQLSKLGQTMDRLRVDKTTTGTFVFDVIKQNVLGTLDAGRKVLIQGMLGGIYLPNIPYFSINVLSAPLLMTQSIGAKQTKASLMNLPMILKMYKQPMDSVVFTDVFGKAWTKQDLLRIEDVYDIGMNRAQVELYESTMKESTRNVGINLQGEQLVPNVKIPQWASEYIGKIDPRYKNIYSEWAIQSDNVFRRSVLYEALKQGRSIEESVSLSRTSLFDYSAMSKFEKDTMNRYVMFWSFTRQNTSAFINSMYKYATGSVGGDGALVKLVRAQQRQHQISGDWLYETDEQKKRLWKWYSGTIDNQPMYTFGFANPYVESFENLLTLGQMSTMVVSPEVANIEKLLNTVQFRPLPQYIIDTYIKDFKSKRVPPDIINLMQTTGNWKWFQQYYHILPVAQTERIVGEPVFGELEQQYSFTSEEDVNSFRFWMLASTMLGANRLLLDMSKTQMAMGDEETMKRFATPTPIGYITATGRSLKTTDPNYIMYQNMKRIEQEFLNAQKEIRR